MRTPIALLSAILVFLAACSGDEQPARSTSSQTDNHEGMDQAAPSATTSELPAATKASADRALTAYEQVRAALAADTTEGVAAAASTLTAAAREAKDSAPDNLDPRFEAVAAEAEKLGGINEIEAARTQFGELSRAVVGLVSTAPALGEGRFVYACPMASGYQKWVQDKEELQNPYMGTKMLACGSKSGWEE